MHSNIGFTTSLPKLKATEQQKWSQTVRECFQVTKSITKNEQSNTSNNYYFNIKCHRKSCNITITVLLNGLVVYLSIWKDMKWCTLRSTTPVCHSCSSESESTFFKAWEIMFCYHSSAWKACEFCVHKLKVKNKKVSCQWLWLRTANMQFEYFCDLKNKIKLQ